MVAALVATNACLTTAAWATTYGLALALHALLQAVADACTCVVLR